MPKHFLILIACLFAFNCDAQNPEEKLIGTWGLSGYDNVLGTWTYKKVKKTEKFTRSYRFEIDGKVFVRTNGSGCSVVKANGKTAKYPLDEFLGSWTLVNDTLAQVKYEAGFIGEFIESVQVIEDKLTVQLTTK